MDRFVTLQKNDFKIALSEIKNIRKRSHWMWYIFPQLKVLNKFYQGFKCERTLKIILITVSR
jgi:uncharacterized protein (DUF1810 family)